MSGGAPVTQQPVEVLLGVVRQLLSELHPHRSNPAPVTLDSLLDRDLGFDSLERMELLHRLEQAFGVHLPEQDVVGAEVPRDLWHALRRASPVAQAADVATAPGLETPAVGEAPSAAGTLIDALAWHVRHHPDRPHITLVGDGDQADTITYADLQHAAEAVAGGLQARGLQPQQTVALMLPTGREFFAAFFGILLAGGIPVPIYPPARLSQIEEHLRRQIRILANAGIVVLITVSEAQSLARLLRAQIDTLHSVLTVEALSQSGASLNRYPARPHDVAFLQYTSGSTGNPKGVILTHDNLLANLRVMGRVVGIESTDVFVSWLPLYHDMGLIGAWLGSLYFAYRLVLMSPLTFLARPARWLWAIHRHRGTISAGPNFAYELCVSRIAEADLEGLDLSSWRYAFNGAESVSAHTMSRFTERFAAYGFRPQAMKPVYGLAEVTLGLAFPPTGSLPQVDHVSRDTLMRSGQAVPVAADDPAALHVVASGQPLPGYQIRIVDAMGYEAGERQEGRLEFRGPSTTQGYYRNPEATRGLFNGDWLDSGDMAYVAAGTVYLTGRAKDMIIRAGRNIYPQEVEEALNEVPGLRRGCSAVFGSPDPATGTERLVVLSETRETAPAKLEELRSRINGLVLDMLGTPADDVVLAPPGSVLKTSSGKLRRGATRERYEQGLLGRRPRAVWWQLAPSGARRPVGSAAPFRPQRRRRSVRRLFLDAGGVVPARGLETAGGDAQPVLAPRPGAPRGPPHAAALGPPPAGGGRPPSRRERPLRGRRQPRQLPGRIRADVAHAGRGVLRGQARTGGSILCTGAAQTSWRRVRGAFRHATRRRGHRPLAAGGAAGAIRRLFPGGHADAHAGFAVLPHGRLRGCRAGRRAGGARGHPGDALRSALRPVVSAPRRLAGSDWRADCACGK